MKKELALLVMLLGLIFTEVNAQKKVVVLDISCEKMDEYLKVSPNIFNNYRDIIENQLNASLIINEDKLVDKSLLKKTDVLILLSTLTGNQMKRPRTQPEIKSIVDFVRNGGNLILFVDEDKRINMEAFGANELVKPFGMEYGSDLPYKRNTGAISFYGEFIKGRYELPYSGSRELKGGIPISVMNAEGGNVHGAYIKTSKGGKLVAFAETMVGLFIGLEEAKLPDGTTLVWKGKDNKQFMLELIDWALND